MPPRSHLCFIVVVVLAGARSFADPTPLVTGNGFGLAFYAEKAGAIDKLLAHPYSFTKPDPKDDLGEGIETANFVTKLAWDEPGAAQASLVNESHIILLDRSTSRQTFFMPFGVERNVLIATWQAKKALAAATPALCAQWAHAIASQKVQRVDGIDVRLLRFKDVDETLVVVPLGPETKQAAAKPACLTGRSAWALVSLEDAKEVDQAVADVRRWADGRAGNVLVERELKDLEAWRVKPTVTFGSEQERRLWRQSEIMLRMAQSREPNRPGRNNHGVIVAVLADGTWTVPWIRDMSYAIHALTRMGHQAEARAGIEAYFHAQPVGRMQKDVSGVPYQISVVRLFGDGSEEPYFTNERGRNIEFDNWGLVLWVLGEYIDTFHDQTILATKTYRGTIYDSAKQYIVKPLLANLEPYQGGTILRADTSIWEERQKDKKHFAFSNTVAIVGLRAFDALAVARKDTKQHGELAHVLPKLELGFRKAFVRGGSLHGTLEPGIKNDIDGAVLSAINFKIVTDPDVIKGTIEQMARLKVASGGYRRVTCILKDPKIFEYYYERQEFLFVDFNLAEVYLRLRQPENAAPLLATIVEKAARDSFFIPEMYVSVINPLFKGEIGQPTGAIPIVGYGAGAYIAYLTEREQLRKTP